VEVLTVVTIIPTSVALALLLELAILKIIVWLLQLENYSLSNKELAPSLSLEHSCSGDFTPYNNASADSASAA
jgi:hypothetical protein